jgi:hypothetical protein
MSVEEKFLDMLAQSGSGELDAGSAVKRLRKYLSEAKRDDNPTFLLMRLRSRGHIEISTTQKGHMLRVYAVQPTIYQLPLKIENRKVYGVLGTLRFAHWDILLKSNSIFRAYRERLDNRPVGAIRLVEELDGGIEQACLLNGSLEVSGFRYSKFPSFAIANWSESINIIRETALQNPMESIGKAQDSAMRFNAIFGMFSAKPSDFPIELLRAIDSDTGLSFVHYLVERLNIHEKFAFVRDSRWGVWIAWNARLHQLSLINGFENYYPIPLSYDPKTKTVWLPARIGLPVVLERALVLCSGALPIEFELVQKDSLEDGCLALFHKVSALLKIRVNPVYQGMANGKWLAYKWVPEPVATAIASKLGARLDFI